MIKRTITIYTIDERQPKPDASILVFDENGLKAICHGNIFDICPKEITHWCFAPEVETAFEKAVRKGFVG